MKDSLQINNDLIKVLKSINDTLGVDDYSSFNNYWTPLLTGISCVLLFVSLLLVVWQIRMQRKSHLDQLDKQEKQHAEQIKLLTEQHKADLALIQQQINIQIGQRERDVFNERFDILKSQMTNLYLGIFKAGIKDRIKEFDDDTIKNCNAINFFAVLHKAHQFLQNQHIYQEFGNGILGQKDVISNEAILGIARIFRNFYFNVIVEYHTEIGFLIEEISNSNLQEQEKNLLYDKISDVLLHDYIYIMAHSSRISANEWRYDFDLVVYDENWKPISMFASLNFGALWGKLQKLGIKSAVSRIN